MKQQKKIIKDSIIDTSRASENNPLEIVRRFQKKYREISKNEKNITHKWVANSNSSVKLKQKNYVQGFQ